MNHLKKSMIAVAVCLCVVLPGCMVASPQEVPEVGAEGGPCFANGTCYGGLTCASGLCVQLPGQDSELQGPEDATLEGDGWGKQKEDVVADNSAGTLDKSGVGDHAEETLADDAALGADETAPADDGTTDQHQGETLDDGQPETEVGTPDVSDDQAAEDAWGEDSGEGPLCPEGTTVVLTGECEPVGTSVGPGGAAPFLYFPIADSAKGCMDYPNHPQKGCDLAVSMGTAIGSPVNGTVLWAKGGCDDNYEALFNQYSVLKSCNKGAGNYIVILTSDGHEVWLEHLKKGSILVSEGDSVCAGQQVALSGSSGSVFSSSGGTGAHLHVASKVSGAWIYPDSLWLDKENLKLGSAAPNGCGCQSQASKGCYGGNLYWVDSCGTKGGLAQNCGGCGCSGDACTACATCGDGVKNGSEQCDSADLSGANCTTMGFASGTLKCSGGCLFDTSACCTANSIKKCSSGNLYWYDSCGNKGGVAQNCGGCGCVGSACTGCASCGDGVKNGSEQCDGSDLGGATCGSQGYSSGSLFCTNSCTLDTGDCCQSNATKSCSGVDLYWYDSCGTKASMAEDCACGCSSGACTTPCCTANSYKSCSGGDLWWYNSCGEKGSMAQDCACGCSSGACTPCCTANSYKSCSGGDLWWYNSCGEKGSMAQDCGSAGCSGSACSVAPTCPSGTGYYCGNNPAVGLTSGTLYYCSAGSYSFSKYCAGGCVVAPPGTNDYCKTSTCPSGNGQYCGNNPSVNLTSGTLYNCSAGSYSVNKVCAAGCKVMPAGQNDVCN